MRRTVIVGGILVVCGAVWFAQTGTAAQSGSSAAVKQIADDYVKAVRAGDAKAVAALYTETATEMPPNQPAVKGRVAIEQYYQKDFTSPTKLTNFSLAHIETQEAGDTAYDVGTYQQSITPAGGQPITDTGKYVVIAKRTAGAWRIAYVIYNSDRPSRPPM